MRRTFLVVVGVLAASGPALAEDLPRFDVRLYCAANGPAERGGPGACRRAEEAARGVVAGRWNTYPKQRKHFCVQSVTFRAKDQRSYSGLAECLDDPARTS